MVVLKFAITVPPVSYIEESTLKEYLKQYNGDIIKWSKIENVAQVTKPRLEAEVILVEYEISSRYSLISQYLQLIRRWCEEDLQIDSQKKPWLTITDKSAFNRRRYSSHKDIKVEELCFGVLVSSSHYLCHFSNFSSDFEINTVNFYHDIRQMELFYKELGLPAEYKLVIEYKEIKRIIAMYSQQEAVTHIYLDLYNPPLVYRRGSIWRMWRRVLTIPSLQKHILGQSNVILLKIDSDKEMTDHSILSRLHARCSIPIYYVNMMITRKEPIKLSNVDIGHFGNTYMTLAIFKKNFYALEQLGKNIDMYLATLKKFSLEDNVSLEKTLIDILQGLDSGIMFNVIDATCNLYNWHKSKSGHSTDNDLIVPPKSKLIRRIVLTPTRQLFWPPDIMSENRILRNFDEEHTLRITFRDDNYNRLPSMDYDSMLHVDTVLLPMIGGLIIGRRKYEFLAWSNSQLRDHSVWLYAKDLDENTASSIQKWMGEFSSIRNVAKYMARMGQCFSQTEDTVFVPLDESSVQTEEDIKGGFDEVTGKQYCFSDGIGKISESLTSEALPDAVVIKTAKTFTQGILLCTVCITNLMYLQVTTKVCKVLGLKKPYSAFQIRYAGYKGMLTMDPTLKDVNIIFRESMRKFECPQSRRLEIVKISNSNALQLNRPFITILDQMGIPHNIFLKMQEDMIIKLIEMFLDDQKAADYLTLRCSLSYLKFQDLHKAGFHLTGDPFFRLMLLAIHKRAIWGIRTKAQVDVDPGAGRNMFGVIDETGILQYGQVFVQYTTDLVGKRLNLETTILKGPVLVTKNPCLQPGDVRVLQAIDVPDLHHIVDCIVFPQLGQRPHPDEMGGADLDGDEYMVIWKKDLIFTRNAPPRHVQAAVLETLPDPVTVTDMIDFLVKFIKNDQLGILGAAHLAHADCCGLDSPKCEMIANKYSVAVDFPKTGRTERLRRSDRPYKYPDFMEKKDKRKYKSKRALGKMFRVCQSFLNHDEISQYIYEDVKVDPDLVYPGWEEYHEDAERLKNKYIQHLKQIMIHYGIQHEAEIISGNFSRLQGRHYQRNEVQEIINKSVCTLWKNMRKEFQQEFVKNENGNEFACIDITEMHNKILSKASACYMVTYSKNSKYLSFPWILTKYLINIKIIKSSGCLSKISYGYSLSKLDLLLKEQSVSQQIEPLENEILNKLRNYDIKVPNDILCYSLQLIIKWAYLVKILSSSTDKYSPWKPVTLLSLFDVFIEAMVKEGYLCKPYSSSNIMPKNQKLGPTLLCVSFFRFCVSLRNLTKTEVRSYLPFPLDCYRTLAKCAASAYQRLAVIEGFRALGVFGITYQTEEENVEWVPVQLAKEAFPKNFSMQHTLNFAKLNMMRWSGVQDIEIREEDKHVIVTFSGPVSCCLTLEQILNKNISSLKLAFTTGNVTEKDQIDISQTYK